MNTVDPKCKPWALTREDLKNISNENTAQRKNDTSLCLTHGFHHQVSYSFKDPIRCVAYRSNSFMKKNDDWRLPDVNPFSRRTNIANQINHGTGPGNVLHLRLFTKSGDPDSPAAKAATKEHESYSNRFPVHGPSLQHIVWVAKHRLFVAIGSDKNLRVFSDTLHRCQPISAPTVCAMPVLSMVYLEATDEVVTGGIGVIQPWKIRLSTNLRSSQSDESSNPSKNRRSSVKLPGIPKQKINTDFGHGRQMLQAATPFPCDLRPDDWVMNMGVYNGKPRLLVGTSSSSIVAIDYMRRRQLWSIRLHDAQYISPGDKLNNSRTVNRLNIPLKFYSKSYVIHGHVSLTRCDFFQRFGYFVTAGGEGTIRIMHMVNFGLVSILRGHRGAVTGLVAHPIHCILISASVDGSIRIWCLETFRMTQRIDTGQKIVNLRISNDPNFFYFYSKQKISVYRLTSVYSLYSVLHSTAAKLTKIEGDEDVGIPGKILAALEDGSVAVMSPVTGLLLTMIYPMNTFQVFTEMTYDPFQNLGYIKLQDGHVMQCDCSTNPSSPVKQYVPTIPFDQDVSSLTSVWIRFEMAPPTTAIFAGLRNGQIALVHPNSLYMQSTQAHTGHVKYIGTLLRDDMSMSSKDTWWCREKLLSVGISSVRTWKMKLLLMENPFHAHCEWEVCLEPEMKVILPETMVDPILLTVLPNRLCVSTRDNQILVLVIQSKLKQTLAIDQKKISNKLPLKESDFPLDRAETSHSLITTNNSNMIRCHHHDDDHVTPLTSLENSQKLNCFASSSEDGFVKIWDEENRLIREICFSSHRVTAMCFANGRDLLVALEGRICLVECGTFMTRGLIKDRNVCGLSFTDDINEPAIPYDDEIAGVADINDLPNESLEALQRFEMPDLASTLCAKENEVDDVISDIPRGDENIRISTKSNSLDKVDIIQMTSTGDTKRLAKSSTVVMDENKISINLQTPDNKLIETQNLHEDSSTGYFSNKGSKDESGRNQAEHKAAIRLKWRKCISRIIDNLKSTKSSTISTASEVEIATSLQTKDNDELSGITANSYTNTQVDIMLNKETYAKKIMETLGLTQVEIDRILESNFPIAPDCFIPNSVIRMKVKPPPPPEPIQMEEWKLKPAPSGPTTASDETSATSDVILDYDISESTMHLDLGFSLSMLSIADDSFYSDAISDKSSSLKLGPMSSLAGHTKDNSINKVNFFNEMQQRESILNQEQVGHVQIEESSSTGEKKNSRKLVRTRASRSDIVTSSAPTDVPAAATKPAGFTPKKFDMKAKLMEQRATAIEKAKEVKVFVPPLLKEVTSAAWFRKKLEKITPDTVAQGLIEMGDTVRVFAHEKACENLLMIVQEFPVKPGGGEENLSPEALANIQRHIANFIKPSYDSSNPHADHANRVALAHNALDTVISGIEPNEMIQRELFRLLVDQNHGLREKAKLILEVKLGIDSWEKLCGELNDMAGGSVLKTSEETAAEQKEVLNCIEDRLNKGQLTMANAPRIASRLGFEVVPLQRTPTTPVHQRSLTRRSSGSSVFGRSIENLPAISINVSARKILDSNQDTGKPKRDARLVRFKGTSARRCPLKQPSRVTPLNRRGDAATIILSRPKIPWEKAVPKRSRYRRAMTGLIQMMSSSNHKSTMDVIKKMSEEQETSIQGEESGDSSYMHLPTLVSNTAVTKQEDDKTRERSERIKLPKIFIKRPKNKAVKTKEIIFERKPSKTGMTKFQGRKARLGGTTLKISEPMTTFAISTTKIPEPISDVHALTEKARADRLSITTVEDTNDSAVSIDSETNTESMDDMHSSKSSNVASIRHEQDAVLNTMESELSNNTNDGHMEFLQMSNTSIIKQPTDGETETIEDDKSKILRLPRISNIRDSGFAESMKTNESLITPDSSDCWRDVIVKLRDIRHRDSEAKHDRSADILRQGKRDRVVRRALASSTLAPGERIASHYIVDNRTTKTESRRICPLPAKLTSQPCSQSKGSCRYGIMAVKWTDNRKMNDDVYECRHENGVMTRPDRSQETSADSNTGMRCDSFNAKHINECCLKNYSEERENSKGGYSRAHERVNNATTACIAGDSNKNNLASCTNVARSKALKKILAAARARETDARKKSQCRDKDVGVRITKSQDGKTSLRVKIPQCEPNFGQLHAITCNLPTPATQTT